MEFGAAIFFTDYSMGPAELGRALEERGFESLWAPEHSHIPLSRRSPISRPGSAVPGAAGIAARGQPHPRPNAGITSRENRVSCSIISSRGVESAHAIITWSRPGYRASSSLR